VQRTEAKSGGTWRPAAPYARSHTCKQGTMHPSLTCRTPTSVHISGRKLFTAGKLSAACAERPTSCCAYRESTLALIDMQVEQTAVIAGEPLAGVTCLAVDTWE